jgi:hypothetical protein
MPGRWRPSTVRRPAGSPSSYDGIVNATEPTVLWRLFHPRGRHARAVLLPGEPPLTLMFFVDDVMDRAENFEAMEIALFRSDEVRRSLLGDGWKDDE